MNNFLDSLYSYDNFGIYLIIAIVILVILFFVILFFGKKDKKNRELEETRKLEKLNLDLFKKDDNPKENEVVVEDATLQKEEEPLKPITDESKKEEVVENTNISHEEPISIEPILSKEEEKPLVLEDQQPAQEIPVVEENHEESIIKPEETVIPEYNYNDIASRVAALQNEDSEVKEPIVDNVEGSAIPEVKEEPTIPSVTSDGPVTTIEEDKLGKGPQVFSSVYAPLNEDKNEVPKVAEPEINEVEETKEVQEDDVDDFELPSLKGEEDANSPEIPTNAEIPSIPTSMEEPTTPSESKSEPVLNNIDLDSIMGESYDINK